MDRDRYDIDKDADPTKPYVGLIIESKDGMVRGIASCGGSCISWVRMSGKGRYNGTASPAQWARWARGGKVLVDGNVRVETDEGDERSSRWNDLMGAEVDTRKALIAAAEAWADTWNDLAPADQEEVPLVLAVRAMRQARQAMEDWRTR